MSLNKSHHTSCGLFCRILSYISVKKYWHEAITLAENKTKQNKTLQTRIQDQYKVRISVKADYSMSWKTLLGNKIKGWIQFRQHSKKKHKDSFTATHQTKTCVRNLTLSRTFSLIRAWSSITERRLTVKPAQVGAPTGFLTALSL